MLPDYTDWRQLVAKPSELASSKVADSNQAPIFLVVDDHDAILQCFIPLLKKTYPKAQILAARDRQSATACMQQYSISLSVLDLEIPEQIGENASSESGLVLLKFAMNQDRLGSILTLGENVKPLRQLRLQINRYTTGFAAIDKTQPVSEALKLIDLALKGSIHLPLEVRSQADFNEKWTVVLRLKYQTGLSDRAIANHLGVSPRTIRSYWPSIQDQLGVYDDPDKDLRVQIEQAARQAGLIS